MNATTPFIQLNGQPHPFEPGQTVADLVGALAMTGKRIAVERNGDIVPKARHADTRLEAGDRIEIVVAVGGG